MDGLESLRSLRHLPAAVPDLSRARRGDGLAARARLPHARGGRGPHRPHAASSRATSTSASAAAAARRPVPPACPSASSSRPRGRSSSARASARPRATTRRRAGRSRPSRIPARLAPLLWGLRLYQASGAPGPRPRVRHAGAVEEAQGHGGAAARGVVGRALPEFIPGARPGARAGRGFSPAASSASSIADVNARTARLLSAAGWDVVVPRAPGLLRGAPPPRGTARRVPRPWLERSWPSSARSWTWS